MTRGEIKDLFYSISEIEIRVGSGLRCVHCCHNAISTINMYGFLQKNIHILLLATKQGSITYRPLWHIDGEKRFGGFRDTPVAGITEIDDIFCGVGCLINFVYEHQNDLVELITQ